MPDATTPAAVLCVLVQLPEAAQRCCQQKLFVGRTESALHWASLDANMVVVIQYDSYGYLRTESYYHVVLGVLDILALFMILSPRNPLLSTYFKAHFLTKPLPKLNFLLLQLA